MLGRLISRIEGYWRQVRSAGVDQRTVLAITRNQRLFTEFRVLAIQQRWSIRFASGIAQGLAARPRTGICVAVLDRDLSGVNWARDVELLSRAENPVLSIVLSDRTDATFRKAVVRAGGYDVARSPVDPAQLAEAINSALQFADEIDSCEAPVHA